MSTRTIPERLVPIQLPPGLSSNGTIYQNKGRWYDAQLVRFHEGMVMPVGGWKNVLTTGLANVQVTGAPRGALAYVADSGTRRLAIGTNSHAYDYADGTLTDITPAGFTVGGADGAFTTGAYGAGTYGSGPYGSGTGGVTLTAAPSWSFDNFGQILVGCFPSDGRILQSTNGSQMTVVDATAPTQCVGLVVTPERFIVALGGIISGGATADSRYLSWASQGTLTVWPTTSTPTSVSDTRGSWKLQSRGRLVAGRRTRTETLIWTDSELFIMTFVGAGLIYSVQQRGAGCGLIAPNACATVVDVAYWMSYGKFHMYNGAVADIPCSVLDRVFALAGNTAIGTQMDPSQQSKTFCHTNTTYHEITWYYASMIRAVGSEPDRYVTYNYKENTWTTGALNRSAGVDRDVYAFPMLIDSSGFLYEHEVGTAMPGVAAGSPFLPPFLISAPVELSSAYGTSLVPTAGDQVFMVDRFLPDERTLGDLQTTVFVALNPTDAEVQIGPFVHAAPTTFRATGRQVRLRHDQVRATSWRLGVNRFALIPGGLR